MVKLKIKQTGVLACVIAALGAAAPAQQDPGVVGFRTLELRDASRAYGYEHGGGGPTGRPMQIAIWYPAAEPNAMTMSLRRYVRRGALHDTLRPDAALSDRAVRALTTLVLYDPDRLAEVLDAPTRAHLDAAPMIEAGGAPLIVMAMGSGAPWYNNYALAEALAARGYVVAASRSAARVAPLMSLDADGVETSARDLEFIVSQLAASPQVDAGRVGVIGRSWGAVGAVVFSARNEHVDAVVSLDGTISYNADTLREEHVMAGFGSAEDVRDPIFVAVGEARSAGAPPIDAVSYFEDLDGAPAYLARYHDLTHAGFASRFLALNHRASDSESARERYGPLAADYAQMIEDVAAFLDHYVRDQAGGEATFVDHPARTIEHAPAEHRLDDPYAFERLAMDHGVPTAIARYEALTAQAPADYRMFGWRSLDNLATYFVEHGRMPDLLALVAFAEARYPDRAVFAVREGQGRLISGDEAGAIAAFERALTISEDDAWANAYLARLRPAGPD